MSAKTSAARRRAFFRALAETGNQTISAERARVSRSWVTLHRASDPAFRTRLEACIADARERIRAASSIKPARKWAYLDGEELVIRGTNGRRAQVSRARLRQWTAATERVFLRTLAATANVRAACREAGLSVPSAYVHRSKYNSFAERWDEALDIAETRLDFALVTGCSNALGGGDPEIDCEGPLPTSFDQIFMVLRAHKKYRRRTTKLPRPRTTEELRADILKKVRAIRAARKLPENRLRADAE